MIFQDSTAIRNIAKKEKRRKKEKKRERKYKSQVLYR